MQTALCGSGTNLSQARLVHLNDLICAANSLLHSAKSFHGRTRVRPRCVRAFTHKHAHAPPCTNANAYARTFVHAELSKYCGKVGHSVGSVVTLITSVHYETHIILATFYKCKAAFISTSTKYIPELMHIGAYAFFGKEKCYHGCRQGSDTPR